MLEGRNVAIMKLDISQRAPERNPKFGPTYGFYEHTHIHTQTHRHTHTYTYLSTPLCNLHLQMYIMLCE